MSYSKLINHDAPYPKPPIGKISGHLIRIQIHVAKVDQSGVHRNLMNSVDALYDLITFKNIWSKYIHDGSMSPLLEKIGKVQSDIALIIPCKADGPWGLGSRAVFDYFGFILLFRKYIYEFQHWRWSRKVALYKRARI